MVRCPPTPTPAADFNAAFLLLYARALRKIFHWAGIRKGFKERSLDLLLYARAFSIICEESLHWMLYARALRKIVAFDAIRKGFKNHM